MTCWEYPSASSTNASLHDLTWEAWGKELHWEPSTSRRHAFLKGRLLAWLWTELGNWKSAVGWQCDPRWTTQNFQKSLWWCGFAITKDGWQKGYPQWSRWEVQSLMAIASEGVDTQGLCCWQNQRQEEKWSKEQIGISVLGLWQTWLSPSLLSDSREGPLCCATLRSQIQSHFSFAWSWSWATQDAGVLKTLAPTYLSWHSMIKYTSQPCNDIWLSPGFRREQDLLRQLAGGYTNTSVGLADFRVFCFEYFSMQIVLLKKKWQKNPILKMYVYLHFLLSPT